MHIVDQTQHFQGLFQVFRRIFSLINKRERSQKNQEVKSFGNFLLIAALLMPS